LVSLAECGDIAPSTAYSFDVAGKMEGEERGREGERGGGREGKRGGERGNLQQIH
jgi:hypothetical protein